MSAPTFTATIAMTLPSVANLREHFRVRAARTKAHRSLAKLSCARARLIPLPVVVTMTRIAPRKLDDDNLASAFKAIRDGITDALGLKDNDCRITWLCEQQSEGKGVTKVRISVVSAGL